MMKQVTRDQFFAAIRNGKLDVHPTIVNDRYPYAQSWTFPRQPGRPVFGKSIGRIEAGHLVNDYFVETAA